MPASIRQALVDLRHLARWASGAWHRRASRPARLTLCILLTGFAGAGLTNAAAQESPYTLLFLGDSLTAGYGLDEGQAYPELIAARLREDGYEQLRVINGGVSGSTSASALSRLQWYLRSEPDLMLLSLGANDGLRGLSVEAMKENLAKTIELAQEHGVEVALTGMMMPPNYGPEYTEAFAGVFPALAREYDLPFLPFLLEGVAAVPEMNQADGIHPNEAGTQRMAEHVYNFLKPLLPPPTDPS